MVLITDLDKTIVYSREYNHKCVERKDNGNPITFMTKKAETTLKNLLKRKDFTIIPCTLRSFEQTKRIDFTKKGTLPYIICDNGFSIYHNGELDMEWDSIVNNLIHTDAVEKLYIEFDSIMKEKSIPLYRLKINRNGFISIIFDSKEDEYKNDFLSIINTNKYRIEDQGKKIYIVPKRLNKFIAVKYLMDKMKNEIVVTAGDSLVDKKFTTLGNYSIIPRHATFRHHNSIVTTKDGIEAGEEIVMFIEKMLTDNNENTN